jgi:uncharacterized membrane protein YkvA (DUF1232 family)
MKIKEMKQKFEQKTNKLKKDIGALFYAYKHKNTPIIAKVIALIVVGYALSPIDLIPDFIPVLGYLDDFILLPLGIALAIKLIPPEVMKESRDKAAVFFQQERRNNRIAAVIIIGIWIIVAGILIANMID